MINDIEHLFISLGHLYILLEVGKTGYPHVKLDLYLHHKQKSIQNTLEVEYKVWKYKLLEGIGEMFRILFLVVDVLTYPSTQGQQNRIVGLSN
jgi:hypothetical protein